MRRLLLTGAAFAAMGFSSAAAAQDVALDEVVVTAQKRTENLQEVPIAVSAIAEDRVESLAATVPSIGRTQTEELGRYIREEVDRILASRRRPGAE